jgi:sec-independent protein translocase protein TatB
MFDLDAGKLIVFGIVALAVIPPKDLPRVLRTVGKYVGQMRRMASDFQGQFTDAMKEMELESVKKEIEEINQAAKVDTSFDPAGMMRDHMEKAVDAAPTSSVYETVNAQPPALPPSQPAPLEIEPPAEKAASNVT